MWSELWTNPYAFGYTTSQTHFDNSCTCTCKCIIFTLKKMFEYKNFWNLQVRYNFAYEDDAIQLYVNGKPLNHTGTRQIFFMTSSLSAVLVHENNNKSIYVLKHYMLNVFRIEARDGLYRWITESYTTTSQTQQCSRLFPCCFICNVSR